MRFKPRYVLHGIVVTVVFLGFTHFTQRFSTQTSQDDVLDVSVNRSDNEDHQHSNVTSDDDDRYVLGSSFKGRLGNQLFVFAVSLYIARWTGRRAVLRNDSTLVDWFQMESLKRIRDVDAELCPCYTVRENYSMTFERSLIDSKESHVVYKTIVMKGSFYSSVYVTGVEDQLRRYLRPVPSLSAAVRQFFDDVRPSRWRSSSTSDRGTALDYRRIGIHVRAGDTLTLQLQLIGYVIPTTRFFERAMRRAIEEDERRQGGDGDGVGRGSAGGGRVDRRNVHFIVATDSIQWVRDTYNLESIATGIARNWSSSRSPLEGATHIDVELSYSVGHESGFDLLMLSMCDALVITHGAFGWWSAWLGNRTTVYFKGSPRKGSFLDGKLPRLEFYPPSWIGLDDVMS